MDKSNKAYKTIEKYEIKVCFILRKIDEVQQLIKSRKNMKRISEKNNEKILDAVQRFENAKKELYEGVKNLLDAAGL